MTAWTPGEWSARNCSVFAGKNCIANTDTDNDTMERYEANARLIASAPTLYDALAEIVRKINEYIGVMPTGIIAIVEETARPALLKARGDQPDSDPPIPNSATPQGA